MFKFDFICIYDYQSVHNNRYQQLNKCKKATSQQEAINKFWQARIIYYFEEMYTKSVINEIMLGR